MALPKQTAPVFSAVVPSTEDKIKFKPFLVKHEKALLIAQQTEDLDAIVDTIKEVLTDCIQSPIDIDNLAIFDIEYLLSQIRSKSVGEISELIFACDTCNDPKARVKIPFDLTKLKVEKNPEHNKKISLFDNVGIVMKYPNINTVKRLDKSDLSIEDMFRLIIDSIEYIYDDNEIYYTKEQTKEELIEFVNNLTQEQFSKIQSFFETMPKLRQRVTYNCPVCGAPHNKYIEGIESFL